MRPARSAHSSPEGPGHTLGGRDSRQWELPIPDRLVRKTPASAGSFFARIGCGLRSDRLQLFSPPATRWGLQVSAPARRRRVRFGLLPMKRTPPRPPAPGKQNKAMAWAYPLWYSLETAAEGPGQFYSNKPTSTKTLKRKKAPQEETRAAYRGACEDPKALQNAAFSPRFGAIGHFCRRTRHRLRHRLRACVCPRCSGRPLPSAAFLSDPVSSLRG
jgi:hypothetical protein